MMGRKKYSIKFANEIAKHRGGRCISNQYTNTLQRLRWECAEGHIWKASLKSIKDMKSWCPHCYGNIPYSLDDCKKIAIKNRGKCVSNKYSGRNAKLKWLCKFGHIWEASLNSINGQNTWCPHCARKAKLTIQDCVDMANAKGGLCLAKVYINNKTRMQWKCKNGHVWSAIAGNVKSGKWCKLCAPNAPRTIYYCRNIAKLSGGKCLSSQYTNNRQKLKWQCKCKYTWSATLNSVSNGAWCPSCASGKTQRLIAKLTKSILNEEVKVNYRNFNWLRNPKTNKKMEIDIFVPKLKLAIEYDGVQHFVPTRFGGISLEKAKNNLNNVKKLDKVKDRLINENKKSIRFFIRIKYDEVINKNNLIKKFEKIGVI